MPASDNHNGRPHHQKVQVQTPNAPNAEVASRAAVCIGILVHNELKESLAAHLSNDQIAELDPLICNAIYTGFYAMMTAPDDHAARVYTDYAERAVPGYWKPPKLTEHYLEFVKLVEDNQ